MTLPAADAPPAEPPVACEARRGGAPPLRVVLSPAGRAAAPPAPATPSAPRTPNLEEIEAELTDSLARALYMQPAELDRERGFGQIGLDSIISVEWVQSLNNTYDLNITVTKVYGHPNLHAFSRFLHDEIGRARAQATPANRHPYIDEVLRRVSAGALAAEDALALLAGGIR